MIGRRTLPFFIPMYYLKVSSNIMSLGGLALAIAVLVDAAIVMVENGYRHLSEKQTQTDNGKLAEWIDPGYARRTSSLKRPSTPEHATIESCLSDSNPRWMTNRYVPSVWHTTLPKAFPFRCLKHQDIETFG